VLILYIPIGRKVDLPYTLVSHNRTVMIDIIKWWVEEGLNHLRSPMPMRCVLREEGRHQQDQEEMLD
jgi:hypothetical protein